MRFLLGILSGLWAELRATCGVWTLLRRRFWAGYILLILATISVPFLPGALAAIGATLMVVALGLGGIFSGMAAKRVRKLGWVWYPDGPEVVPYLSNAIAILLGPPFFLAMVAMFQSLGAYLPEMFSYWDADRTEYLLQLPATWWRSFTLALDNVLYTAIFFDFFESFRLRAGPKPQGVAAPVIIFLVRTLVDIAFIKLTVQLIRAAYFRSLDFGRGGDLIAQTQEACENEDISAARLHSRDVGQSVRAAADDLRAHVDAGGSEAAQAWLGLRAMKAFAIAHFEDRALTQLGEERARTEALIERLKADDGPEPEPRPTSIPGYLLLAFAYVVLLGLTILAIRLAGDYDDRQGKISPAWFLSLGLAVLQGWFLIRPRWWLDRLDAWNILPSARPSKLPARILLWLALLTPLFIVNAAEIVWLVGHTVPSAFLVLQGNEVSPGSALRFVLDNLLRSQLFLDSVDIFSIPFRPMIQQGILGGVVAFLVRLVFNIGLLAVVVPFLLERFNQWFRGVKTRPDAELLLRREARSCGPHSALLIAYYFRQVRDWFVESMNRHRDRSPLLGALAASGFVRDFQAQHPDSPQPNEDATVEIVRRLERGNALIEQGLLAEGEQEVTRAVAQLEQLRGTGRTDLDSLTATARNGQANLAMTHGRYPEAEGYLREAYALAVQIGGGEQGNPHSAFMADVLDSLAIVIGHQSVARADEAYDFSRRSVALYEHLVASGQPELRALMANALGTHGQMLNLLQRWDESVASFQRALGILGDIQKENEKATSDAQGYFGGSGSARPDVRNNMALRQLELAEVYRELRRFGESAFEAKRAVELLDALVREGQSAVRDQLVRALNTLGLSLNDDGKSQFAKPAYERARQLSEALILEGHGNQRRLLGPILNNLGTILLCEGQVVEAEQRFRRSVEIINSMVGEGQSQRQELLVFAYSNLGQALMSQKKMHEAEVEIRKGVEIGRTLVESGQTTLRDELALVLSNLGDLLTHKYQWEDATHVFRESAHLYGQLVTGGAEQYRILRARSLDRLCRSLREFGDLEQAEAEGRNAIAEFAHLARAGQDVRMEQALALRTLGLAHQVNRKFDEALARFDEASKLVPSDGPEDRAARSWLLVDTARVREAQEQMREAIVLLDRAIVLQAQLVDSGNMEMQADLGSLLMHRGDLLFNLGDLESALTAYRESVRRLKPLVDAGRKDLRETLARAELNVGGSLVRLKEAGWSESFGSGLARFAELVGEGDPGATDEYGQYAETLAHHLRQEKRDSEAETVLRQATGVYAKAASDARNLRARIGEARARYILGITLVELGKPAEFQAEGGTALTILEGLLELPEPPDRALRLYRDTVKNVIRRIADLPDPQAALVVGRRVLEFIEQRQAQGQTGLERLFVETLQLTAQIHESANENEEAIALYLRAEEAISEDPFDAYSGDGPAARRFVLQLRTGSTTPAGSLASQALEALAAAGVESPSGVEAWTVAFWQRGLATVCMAEGRRDEAVELYRQAAALLQTAHAEPVDQARALAELLAASSDEGDRSMALSFVRTLPSADALPTETVEAVRALIAAALAHRPEDADWLTVQK